MEFISIFSNLAEISFMLSRTFHWCFIAILSLIPLHMIRSLICNVFDCFFARSGWCFCFLYMAVHWLGLV